MKKYKRVFKESTEKVPYGVYGEGNLTKFHKYFVDKYNNLHKTKYATNDTTIDFKEKKLTYPINQIFVGDVKKYFEVEIVDKKSHNFLYKGDLLVAVDYRSKKIFSNVLWEAVEKSPSGAKEEVSFVFE